MVTLLSLKMSERAQALQMRSTRSIETYSDSAANWRTEMTCSGEPHVLCMLVFERA